MQINILGTDYEIVDKKYNEDPTFKENNWGAYCCGETHQIIMCVLSTYPGYEDKPEDELTAYYKESLRHEITHAFFNESGLKENSFSVDGPWARNEELVDWIAIQGPKLYAAWEKAGAT